MYKVWGAVLAVLGTLAVIGAAVWLFVSLGFDKGNQLASILSFFVGIAGLAATVYGVVLTRKGPSSPVPVPDQPLASNSSIGGGATDLRDVKKDVKIRRTSPNAFPPPVVPPTVAPGTTPPPPSGAMLDNTWVGGSVRRIRGAEGVEINE